jgi:ATP-dependent RNA helicase DHX29
VDWSEEITGGAEDEEDHIQEDVKLEKRYTPTTATTINLLDERLIPYDLIMCLLEFLCFEDAAYSSYSPAILIFMPGIGEIRRLHELLTDHPLFGNIDNFKLYLLHSTVSNENQNSVSTSLLLAPRKLLLVSNPQGGEETFTYLLIHSHQYSRDRYYDPGHHLCH